MSYIVNVITNSCFRFLQEPYTEAPARLKTKFLMSLTIEYALNYSKRHNKFLFSTLAGAIYGSSCKAENEFPMLLTIKITNTNRKTIHFYILSRHLYLFIKREKQISRIIYDIFSGVYNIGLRGRPGRNILKTCIIK